jgi:uncharacterized damage-inducible protein DinB
MFKDLLEYDYWANKEVLNGLLKNRDEKQNNLLFHHILEANTVWYSRLVNKVIDPNIWDDDFDFNLFETRMNENYSNLKSYLNGCDLEATLKYKNIKGDSFESKIKDILFHIFNHGTHHRAQILSSWSRAGIERPALDFIFYKRQMK